MFRKLALPFLVLAVAGVAASSSSAATPQTLQLLSVQQHATLPTGDPQVGDQMIFVDTLFNRAAQFGKPRGARIGRAELVCTITSNASATCTITAHVPNGQIVLMGALGLSDHPAPQRFAVVGGLGAYGTARGTAVGRDLSPTSSAIVLRLAS